MMHASETVIEMFHAELRKGVQKAPHFWTAFRAQVLHHVLLVYMSLGHLQDLKCRQGGKRVYISIPLLR